MSKEIKEYVSFRSAFNDSIAHFEQKNNISQALITDRADILEYRTPESVMHYEDIKITSLDDLLAIPLVKAYYDCLNDHYKILAYKFLELKPDILAPSSYGQLLHRTADCYMPAIDNIKAALRLINNYLIFQFVDFDLEAYFNGTKYFGVHYALDNKLVTSLLQNNDEYLLNKIYAMFYESESVQYINENLIEGILTSSNTKAIDMVMDLLKSARLAEGLRGSIIDCMHKGNTDTFKRILQYIKDENLSRFSSVKKALANIVTLLYCVDDKSLDLISGYLIDCVIDDKIDDYLASDNALKVYIALYSMGLSEINITLDYIHANYSNVAPHIRTAYIFFLCQTTFSINSKIVTNVLTNSDDENNLFLLLSQHLDLAFDSDDDKRAYIHAYLNALPLVTSKSQYHLFNKDNTSEVHTAYSYKQVVSYTDQLDDLYEEVYTYFQDHGESLYARYNSADETIKTIKHPIMRKVIVDGITSSKSDMRQFAYNKIINLDLDLSYEECLLIADGLKSKVSTNRKNISILLSRKDPQTIINVANVLLDNKNKLKQSGAVTLLVDNLDSLNGHPEFNTIKDKISTMTFSEDISANLDLLFDIKEEKTAFFFDNERSFNVPKLTYDQALVDEFFNIDMVKFERVMTEFMDIFNQHHGEDYEHLTYNGTTQVQKVGIDIPCMKPFHKDGEEHYTNYMFHDEFLEKLKEFTDKELVLLRFICDLDDEHREQTYSSKKSRSLILHHMQRGLLPDITSHLDSYDKHHVRNLINVLWLHKKYREDTEQSCIYDNPEVNKILFHYLAFLTVKEQEQMATINQQGKEENNDNNIEKDAQKCDCVHEYSKFECCDQCADIFMYDFSSLVIPSEAALGVYFDPTYVTDILLNIVELCRGKALPINNNVFFKLIESGNLEKDYLYQLIFDTTDISNGCSYGSNKYGQVYLQDICLELMKKGPDKVSDLKKEMYFKSTQYMVDVELDRTEADTEYSDTVWKCGYFLGAEIFTKALSRMGKLTFVRAYSWGDRGKRDSFSNIISNVRPEADLTQEKFDALIKEYNIDDKRLLEACLYNFRFITFAEQYLKIKGLTKAAYYFKAHMRSISEQDAVKIARYSEIAPADLMDGQMDINWFKESYAELGKKNFEKVYDAAKNLSSGSEHKRAQYFADAVMGKLKTKEVEERINDKRNQEMILAYGLLPLRGDKSNAALKRYKVLQEFLKQSKAFGAQRRQSEALKVSIAINNLANNYGLESDRFVWTMEAKLIEKVSASFTPKSIGEVEVHLDLANVKNPDIIVIKDGKTLKSVPAKYRKHKYIVELKEIKSQLKDQYVRARKTLENSMINEDTYSSEDLKQIHSHPIIHKLLQDLLFISDGHIGFFKTDDQSESSQNENGALVGVNGDVYSLTNESMLRIAHPVDLAAADLMTESDIDSNQSKSKQSQWPAWQTYVMENAIQQPFKQVFRELYTMTEEEKLNNGFTNRFAGYQIEAKRMLGIMKSRGWVINHCEGFEKISHKHNLRIDMYCYADWFMPSSIEQPAIEKVVFMDNKTGQSKEMKSLSKIIYSETMRDIDLVVSVAYVGGVDPMLNHTTLEMRKRILEYNLSLFKIDNYTLDDKHIMIKGAFGNYSIHLGSGIIHMEGRGMLPVFPVHSQQRGHIFLPFVDDDPKTSEIMTKVLMLAKDNTIKDPTVLQHLN